MEQQQFQPVWTKEQVKQYTNIYQGRGHLLSPEYKDKIEQHSAHYNVPFYEGEGGILSAIKAGAQGFTEALTLNIYQGDKPKTQTEAIAKNIGHLIGFAPAMVAGPLGKIAKAVNSRGLSRMAGYIGATGNKISPSMIAADWATKKASKIGNLALASVNKKNVDNLTSVSKLLLGGGARNISHQAFHLGVASAVGTLPEMLKGNFTPSMEAFMGGATAGSVFGVLGNLTGPTLQKMFKSSNPETLQTAETYLKGILGAGAQVQLAGAQDATTPELVYETILGAYFGANAGQWKNARAGKVYSKILKKGAEGTKAEKDQYKEWVNLTGKDIEQHPFTIKEPVEVQEALKKYQKDLGDPNQNLRGLHLEQLAKELNLDIESLNKKISEKTPEGFANEGEYVAGKKVIRVREKDLTDAPYVSTTGNIGDAILAEITGRYGLPTINYVPFRGKKERVVGLDRALTEDQVQQAFPAIVQANKTLKIKKTDSKGKDTQQPIDIANMNDGQRKQIAKNWWAVKNAKEVYLVTPLGGKAAKRSIYDRFLKWPAQFAKDANKPLFVLDSNTGRWSKWNTRVRNFEAIKRPPKPSVAISILGTNQLAKGSAKNIYGPMKSWLGAHFKQAPIANTVQKLANKQNKAKVKDIQSIFTAKGIAKKELDKLKDLEPTDDIQASQKALQANIENLDNRLKTLETETSAEFIQKAVKEIVRIKEEISDVDEFSSENDRRVGNKSLQITQEYLKDFWGKKAELNTLYEQREKKIELAESIDNILYKQFGEIGSKINRSEEAVKAIEDLVGNSFTMPESGKGEIRQALTRFNLGKPIIHYQSDSVSYNKMKSNANPISRAGNRKHQIEPEKYIETVFKEIAGGTESPLAVLDHVTRYSEKRGFNVDMEISRFRSKHPKEYAKFIKNISQKASKDGMYIFGGASDKDRLYFMKYHPELTNISAKDLFKTGITNAKELRLSREQSKSEEGLTTEQHDKAFISNVLYDLSMNGLETNIAGLQKFVKANSEFVKGSAPFNKRAQIWFTNSYKADSEFVKKAYESDGGVLNANDKYNVIIVKDLKKELEDYGLNSLENIENPEHVDGAIIVPDRLLNVINKDFGVPDSGQNKSFIVSPNAEHGALLGKYMMHSAGPKMSKLMEAQGLHMIMQESAVKQRGTREIGDYFVENGKLDIKAKTYEINPEDVRGSYSVYGNEHFFEPQRLPKQVMMNMLQQTHNNMDQAVIEKAFDDIIGKRWAGSKESNDRLAKYIKESNEGKEPEAKAEEIIKNIEETSMVDIVEAIRNESSPVLAEAIYQKMLKVTKETVANEYKNNEINNVEYEQYLTELSEFNSITDRMIKQGTMVSEKARSAGYNINADSIYNHKFIRDFKAKAVQNFLVNSATKPHMGNSGSAYMRPYDKAMQVNLDKSNELLNRAKIDPKTGKEVPNKKGANYNDEVFFLDNGHKKTPIWLKNPAGKEYSEPKTLEEVFNMFNKAKGKRLEYLTEVLTAATVRVPMDSVSGMQVMKFGGFTGRKGHGILLHSKAMRAEGGADLDGDKAFYYFGGTRGMSKDMMEQFYKNKDEFQYTDSKGNVKTKDNKKARISKKVGNYKKNTPIRDLLIASSTTGKARAQMALAETSISHYAPSERIRISAAAVDGRNQLGPAVSNSQLMKGAYNSIVANGGTDVLIYNTKIEASSGKEVFKRFKVTIEARTGDADVKLQRDMARAQLGLASDPMDELGLAGINVWKKLLWDTHFKAVKVVEVNSSGKSEYQSQVLEKLKTEKSLPSQYSKSGIFGHFINLNQGLWGRDYAQNRKYNMDEVQNFLESAISLSNIENASNSFLPKIGQLFSGLDWSDSPFTRINQSRVEKMYTRSNNLIKGRSYLQALMGRSSMKVPYTSQIASILKNKLFKTDSRVEIANSFEDFYSVIKDTIYQTKVDNNESLYKTNRDAYTERLKLLNEMVKEGEDFIVNDMSDIITLNLVENVVKKGNISPKRFQKIMNKVDSLKKNSYLKARDRKQLDKVIDELEGTDLSKFLEDYISVFDKKLKIKDRTSKDQLRTAEMDQAEIDAQIKEFRKKERLSSAENNLFDHLMLGSINRGNKAKKIKRFERKVNDWKNPIVLDYIKYLRSQNSKSNISRLGFSSLEVSDVAVREHLQSYMEMMKEASIPLTKSESANLTEQIDKAVNTLPNVPNTVQKMATNTGFEGIKFLGGKLKNKEIASMITETAELLRAHPSITKNKTGKDLNEFTRGLEFIRKDFDAMDIADIGKLNRYLKQVKEGTIWQRIQKLFGKGKGLSWRNYQQLPGTTNRELMANDIQLARKEGWFTDAKGEVQFGKVKVPTQFMDTLSNSIGRMTEMGTQVGDSLVAKFQEDQMFYQGLEEAPGLWEVAIRQREYSGQGKYRASRAKYNKDLAETENHIKYMQIQKEQAEKKLNWNKVKKTKYYVNLDGVRVRKTGQEIVDRINNNLTNFMEEMHGVIRGNKEFRGEESPYFVEWYDKEKLSPKYNHKLFLKDLDVYLNGRVPNRWKDVMKSTNESIPSIFGIDGVRAMMREMHIDFMMKIGENQKNAVKKKYYINRAIKLSKFPIKDTGKLPFENYFPRMFFEPTIVKQALKKQQEKLINNAEKLTSEEQISKLVKLQQRHKRLDGDYMFEEMNDTHLYDALLTEIAKKDGQVSDSQMNKWFSLDATMGNMRTREYSTEGWSVAPTSVEAYVRSLSNTYFKGLAGMVSRNIVSNPETGIYKKLTRGNKWTKTEAEAWTEFAKLYVNDALGNPVMISKEMRKDPKMALKRSPYALLADNRVAERIGKIAAKLKLKGIVDKDGALIGGVDTYDIQRWSQMEAKFEMAALLAHPKSIMANLMGGSLHTIQSAGLTAFKNVRNYEYLQQINPKLKSRKDVQDMVVNSGVLPQWMAYELGLQKEFQSSKGKEALEIISNYIKNNPDATKGDLVTFLGSTGRNISDSITNIAGKFMSGPERALRTDAFMSHYIKAWESFGGAIKDPNHPFLIEMAKKGVSATQFLYSAPYRPAYARTSLGKVLTRFQMFAWSSVKLRGDMLRRLEIAGFNPNSPEGKEAQRFVAGDMFMLAMANMFPYSLFENNLPQPYGWFQDTSEWLFGDEQERDRAFFGTYPTAIAPLQVITPPIGRVGLLLSGILNGDMERVTNYYVWTMFPFGRIVRDLAGKGGIAEAPIRLVDKLTGIPLTQIQRKKKRMSENEANLLYPKAFTGGYE